MPVLRYRLLAGVGVVACTLLCRPARARAQTVVEMQGGGSSLNGGYGATANFWRSTMDGWIGLGYLDGFRAGVFLRKALNKDIIGTRISAASASGKLIRAHAGRSGVCSDHVGED